MKKNLQSLFLLLLISVVSIQGNSQKGMIEHESDGTKFETKSIMSKFMSMLKGLFSHVAT